MRSVTHNRTKSGPVAFLVLLLGTSGGACSGEGSPSILQANDAILARTQNLSGCLIKAEIVKTKPGGEKPVSGLTARFAPGPAPHLREQPDLTDRIEIIDRAGSTLWSMGYNPAGPGLFRLPCVEGAHAVRLFRTKSSDVPDDSLTAPIEDSQL